MHNQYIDNRDSSESSQGVGAALVVVDVINDLEYPGGEGLLRDARKMAQQTAALKQRATETGLPTIYVNEPLPSPKATLAAMIGHCLGPTVRGRAVVELLRPERDDYFIITPLLHSSAMLTKLDAVAQTLQIHTLILAGLAASIQIRFAANDTHLTNYRFVVPEDCIASKIASSTRSVLNQLQATLNADVGRSPQLPLQSLAYAPSPLMAAGLR